jgi:hypothetical protein
VRQLSRHPLGGKTKYIIHMSVREQSPTHIKYEVSSGRQWIMVFPFFVSLFLPYNIVRIGVPLCLFIFWTYSYCWTFNKQTQKICYSVSVLWVVIKKGCIDYDAIDGVVVLDGYVNPDGGGTYCRLILRRNGGDDLIIAKSASFELLKEVYDGIQPYFPDGISYELPKPFLAA